MPLFDRKILSFLFRFIGRVDNLLPFAAVFCGIYAVFRCGVSYIFSLPVMIHIVFLWCALQCYLYFILAYRKMKQLSWDRNLSVLCLSSSFLAFILLLYFFSSFWLLGFVWVGRLDVWVQAMFVLFAITSFHVFAGFVRHFWRF